MLPVVFTDNGNRACAFVTESAVYMTTLPTDRPKNPKALQTKSPEQTLAFSERQSAGKSRTANVPRTYSPTLRPHYLN